MTVTIPPKVFPSNLPSEHFAQQDDSPSADGLRRVALAYNATSVHHRKLVFSYCNSTQTTPAPGSNSEDNLYFAFRTGENVSTIAILVGLAPASQADGSNSAYVQMSIAVDGVGTTYTHEPMYYPKVASGTYTPAEVAWIWSESSDGVTADTVYLGWIFQKHYARIQSVMVYEIAKPVADSSVTGVADPLLWEKNKPIYDVGVQDLAETGTELWRHNACHLFSWSRKTPATAPTTTSTTYVNMLETGSTTVTATTPGMRINTQYHDTTHGDVPVQLGVVALRTAGTGTASIKLVDGSGTLLEETGITSGTLYTTSHTITAKAAEKTDIHVKVNTAGATWRFDVVGLWEYEA